MLLVKKGDSWLTRSHWQCLCYIPPQYPLSVENNGKWLYFKVFKAWGEMGLLTSHCSIQVSQESPSFPQQQCNPENPLVQYPHSQKNLGGFLLKTTWKPLLKIVADSWGGKLLRKLILPAQQDNHRISFSRDESQEEHVTAATVVALQNSFTQRPILVKSHFLALGSHEMVHNVTDER